MRNVGVAGPLFHMSPCRHFAGRVLIGNGKPKVSKRVEDALEEFRPKRAISRLWSVFASPDADFQYYGLDGGCIFEVVANGSCEIHDASWVGMLQQAERRLINAGLAQHAFPLHPEWNRENVKNFAAMYWAGSPSRRPKWEVLISRVTVVAPLTLLPVEVSETRGGWPKCRRTNKFVRSPLGVTETAQAILEGEAGR